MTSHLIDYGIAPMAFSALFNILLGIVLLRLRHVSERLHLTLSQRWGLTLLAWLYLINAFQILAHIGWRLTTFDESPKIFYLFTRLEIDLTLLSFMFLLSFGLVYPRPVASWRTLRIILAGIALFFIIMVPVQSLYLIPKHIILFQTSNPQIELLYLVATFVPIFLWLPEYEKQESPHMRMILTILIWGYLFVHIAYDVGLVVRAMYYRYMYNYGIIVLTLAGIVVIYLMRAMYYRRGRWTSAEWMNLAFLFITLGFAAGHIKVVDLLQIEGLAVRQVPGIALLEFMTTFGGWCLIRPAIFFYALVRYQVFGPEVRANESFALIITSLGSGLLFFMTVNVLSRFGIGLAAGIGAVIAIIAYILFRRSSITIVKRLLPMSGGGQKVPLAERRVTYLMALQTAVILNRIDHESDKMALEALRRDLKVSQREHDLLMSGFAKEKPLESEGVIKEVYIFHMDGNLLGHIKKGKKVDDEYKTEMIATMFTAVGEFSKDALRSGSKHMDAIEYGDSTLLIEVEGMIASGIMLKGKDNPLVRQRMRDLLTDVQEHYSKDLDDLARKKGLIDKGLEGRFKGIDDILERFLQEK